MIKAKIVGINKYNYILEDNNNQKHNLNIEFYELENNPQVNDYIYISEKILKEKNLYSFGPIKNIDVNDNNIHEDDLIKIVSIDKEYYLERYYG